jgi:hypothetical protein
MSLHSTGESAHCYIQPIIQLKAQISSSRKLYDYTQFVEANHKRQYVDFLFQTSVPLTHSKAGPYNVADLIAPFVSYNEFTSCRINQQSGCETCV